MSTREITYTWRVREIMARRGVHTAKDLAELLHERGITLTANAVWRIVTGSPAWKPQATLALVIRSRRASSAPRVQAPWKRRPSLSSASTRSSPPASPDRVKPKVGSSETEVSASMRRTSASR